MKTIKNYDLKSVAENIQGAEDLEQLKAVENQCLTHFAEKAKSSENWILEEEAKSTGRQVTNLADIRRRQILAAPKIQAAKTEYDLGRMIGQAK